MATVDDVYDRLARLEESQKHLATKADLEILRADLAQMESRLAWRLNGALVAIGVSLVGLMGVLIFQQI